MDTSNQKMIPDSFPDGCGSVFTGGTKSKVFSMVTHFFVQNPLIKVFSLELNITSCFDNGRKITCASGISTLKIFINNPPCCGNCTVTNKQFIDSDEDNVNDYENFGTRTGVALLDEFEVRCGSPHRWKDPDGHVITKYVFKSKYPSGRGC